MESDLLVKGHLTNSTKSLMLHCFELKMSMSLEAHENIYEFNIN